MAKTLSKTGINNPNTIQAWHVSQSVDALTGASDYDITISGSLVITASANQFTPVLIARGQINTFNISSSGNISSSTIFVSNDITSSAFRALNNATIGGTLGVTGATTLSSTLGVAGATTLHTLNVNNDIRLAGTLQATGSQGNFNQLFVSNSIGNNYPRLGWNNNAEWDFLTNVGGLQHGAAWYLSYPQLTEANLLSYQTSSDGTAWGNGVIDENIKSMFYGENIKNNGITLSPIQGNSTQWARFEFDTGYVFFDQFWLRGNTQTSSLYIKVEKRNEQGEYTPLWETTRSAGWPGHIVKIRNVGDDGLRRIRFTFRNISGSGNNDNWKVIYINCFNYLGSYSGTNGPSFFRIYDYSSSLANIKRPLLVTPTTTPSLITSLFTIGQSDNNFKAGFANGSGNSINSEHAKVGMWWNSTVNSTANPVTHIGFLRGDSNNSSGMTFNVNNIEMMRISNTGAITASGAISSSAGLFGTTLTTTGYINDITIGRGGGNNVNNTAIGINALYSNINGNNNTAIGNSALYSNTNGGLNTAIGNSALYSNTNGNSNTAIGSNALDSNTIGNFNIAIGNYALDSNTTGVSNIAIGDSAGNIPSNSNNSIFIGVNSHPQSSNQSNQIVIGTNATGSGNNSVTLGNISITNTVLRGNIQITGSADAILTLTPLKTLPASALSGSLVVSGSGTGMKLYLWNGSNWISQT